MQQHQVFQSYLMRCKKEVYLNLKRKIFPQTKYEDYDFIEVLGQGSYGQVVSAINVHSKNIFAVKIISKKILVTHKRLTHLMSEIRILNSVKFEFLISLECYFTNKCYVFIVLPYVNGGHFFTLLKKVKKFDEEAARFFAGQVILAIEYLHFMGIVYRDLKPENLLLDLQGYLKLVDFGFAKYTGHSYTYTLCGTPEYLAPEVLLGKGYSLSPDWWTLGILLYEMCNGKPPFTSTNQLKMYEKIIVGNINWPHHFSFELKSIIQGLLQVDKTKRLGCMKGKAQDVKFHKWFRDLDWNALWNKKILPPISNPSRMQSKMKNYDDGLKLKISFTKCSNLIPSEMIGNIDTKANEFKRIMLSILRRSKSLKKLTCGRIAFLSQISSNELELKDDEEEKKSPELLKPRELKPFRPHFFIDLYAGVFDKSFFEYPTVLNIEEINVVLNHAQEVENYVSNKEENAAVRQISKDVLKNLKKLNLFGLSIPKEYGGCGYTQTETKFLQECAAINFPIARLLSSNEDLGALVISTFGNEEQKRKYLPKIASGECVATLAYLEDNPIVDLTTFSTTSIKHDEKGGYLITGKKKWVHNANVSDVIIVLTRGTEISYNEVGTKMLFNLFICDRKLPGISIHELKSLRAKELNLYEVDFDKVFVKAEDFLGGEETSVHLMLQSVLSMSQVSVSTMCLSLIKQIIHSAAHYCENKVLDEKPLQEQNHVKENMGLLATYAFALESVIYMVTGRYDLYAEPELLLESSAAKILAADMLQLAIDKYIQILGPNSFKSSGLLDEALKVLQYCSIFDENNLHLKLMMSSAGVIHAAKPKAKNIKQWRQKLEFPWQAIMRQASDDFRRVNKHKLNLKLKMELHTLLQKEADKLETSLARLNNAVENHLIRFGSISLEFEQEMIKFAEAAVYIYATAACLGRASSSFCNYGKDSTCEINMARVFTSLTAGLVERMWFDIVLSEGGSSLYKEVGKITFFNKEYPVAHPIARTD